MGKNEDVQDKEILEMTKKVTGIDVTVEEIQNPRLSMDIESYEETDSSQPNISQIFTSRRNRKQSNDNNQEILSQRFPSRINSKKQDNMSQIFESRIITKHVVKDKPATDMNKVSKPLGNAKPGSSSRSTTHILDNKNTHTQGALKKQNKQQSKSTIKKQHK